LYDLISFAPYFALILNISFLLSLSRYPSLFPLSTSPLDDKIHLEGESTSFSPTGAGKASVIAASVSSSEDSYAWVAIRPAELRGSDISLSFIADLRFMVSRHSLATW
jgi:hypothetical protein